MEWAKDPNLLISEKFAPLIFDHMSPAQKKEKIGNIDFQRNMIIDYGKNPDLLRKKYESHSAIRFVVFLIKNQFFRTRYVSLFSNIFHIAGSEKGEVVYVVVAHATMIEWMGKSLGHPIQKSEYCAINILEDELWEDDQCRIVHQRQF
jgi:hypothetical protein